MIAARIVAILTGDDFLGIGGAGVVDAQPDAGEIIAAVAQQRILQARPARRIAEAVYSTRITEGREA